MNGGTITTALAAPTAEINVIAQNSGGLGCEPAYLVPAGKALIVTSITTNVNTPATTSSTLVAIYAGNACGVNTVNQFAFDAGTHGSLVQPFPAGLAVATGHQLSSVVTGTGVSPNVVFSINGYLVPSSECSSVCH